MEAVLWFLSFVGALTLLMAFRVPVAVRMGLIGMAGTAAFVSTGAVSQIASIAYSQSSSFILVVVPLFILMGEVIAVSGLGTALFRAASIWTRRLPGGLAVGTVGACAGFASVCRSSPVTAATIGAVSVPEMIRNGYSKKLAFGATAAGGTLGILIPPSVPMILYGVITETSIGKLFIAGILPGLMMALLLCATIVIQVLIKPEIAPRVLQRPSFKERMGSLGQASPIVLIAIAVIASIYTGVATPTEAGAVGAAAAIVTAVAMRRLSMSRFFAALDGTVRTTAMFMLLLIGGLFSSFVLTRLGVPQEMSTFLTSLDVAPWVIIVVINIFLLILGMFLDPLSILVIVVPIFLKAVVALGYDPIWFGIMITIQIEIAAITPPLGFNLFVLRKVVPNSDFSDIVNGSLVFVIPLLVGIALLMIFPDIALLLPRLAG
ncbi:TRAP transporter large permease subunit [Chelativorans sp. ZYF759]|uniref:TRAP transporter large permease n=1 Tax=Chelativorans sp. ZYF759 TaxID=2692213 RepID=UPI00145D0D12|nr:TRAP transporter large permease subunit [Chelativorans sp. ZYF759]